MVIEVSHVKTVVAILENRCADTGPICLETRITHFGPIC